MKNTFKILFYIKRSAPLRNGNVPIMGRITIGGQRTQFSTQLSVAPALWEARTGHARGYGEQARHINRILDGIRFRMEQCYTTLFFDQPFVTPIMVKELYLGAGGRHRTIVDFFMRHNEEFGRMVGVSRSKNTYYKYRCVCNHLARFIRERYGRDDLMFRELNREFLSGFHAYIAREMACRKNTIWIYMIALKHILMLARSKGYLTRDLFANYKLHSEFVERNYLSAEELNRIIGLDPAPATLRLVRDVFLFCCFTGLSYCDVRGLRTKHLRRVGDRLWISTKRHKTGAAVEIRLFDLPLAILASYLPEEDDGEPLFALPSNSWCNRCLKQLSAMAGIEKHVTFHTARHTFATTVTLSQGMAIETISKLLGHKSIRTTQIYASITHTRLNAEMERLSKRISGLCHAWQPSANGQSGTPTASRSPFLFAINSRE